MCLDASVSLLATLAVISDGNQTFLAGAGE